MTNGARNYIEACDPCEAVLGQYSASVKHHVTVGMRGVNLDYTVEGVAIDANLSSKRPKPLTPESVAFQCARNIVKEACPVYLADHAGRITKRT